MQGILSVAIFQDFENVFENKGLTHGGLGRLGRHPVCIGPVGKDPHVVKSLSFANGFRGPNIRDVVTILCHDYHGDTWAFPLVVKQKMNGQSMRVAVGGNGRSWHHATNRGRIEIFGNHLGDLFQGIGHGLYAGFGIGPFGSLLEYLQAELGINGNVDFACHLLFGSRLGLRFFALLLGQPVLNVGDYLVL